MKIGQGECQQTNSTKSQVCYYPQLKPISNASGLVSYRVLWMKKYRDTRRNLNVIKRSLEPLLISVYPGTLILSENLFYG